MIRPAQALGIVGFISPDEPQTLRRIGGSTIVLKKYLRSSLTFLRAAFGPITWILVGVCSARGEAPVLTSAQADFFESKVRPLLADQCYDCHSAKAEKLKGSLYLDTREGVAKVARQAKSLSRKTEDSLLIQAIKGIARGLDRMPPEKAKRVGLKPEQICDPRGMGSNGSSGSARGPAPTGAGAEAKRHWAFQRPAAPPIPKIKNKEWVREDLDYFILARLEAQGLQPSPQADKHSLLRRISFDLTGLPRPRTK